MPRQRSIALDARGAVPPKSGVGARHRPLMARFVTAVRLNGVGPQAWPTAVLERGRPATSASTNAVNHATYQEGLFGLRTLRPDAG